MVDAAAGRSRRLGHRFETDLRIRSGLSASATLRGRLLPTGESEARLEWSGPASLVLPDATVRIVGNSIYARSEGDAAWRSLGSASGVALDVGRELLDHPFLLRPVAGREDEHRAVVELVADPAALRAYAGTERRGIATDLLVGARSLRITSLAAGGRLVADTFALTTRLPPALAKVAGGPLARVTGATSYCPLRPADRDPIRSPASTSASRPPSG